MSNSRKADSEAPESGRRGKGRWSAKRKVAVVLELLRGEDMESLSRKYAITAATLSSWRDAFLASGEAGLKIRQVAGQGLQQRCGDREDHGQRCREGNREPQLTHDPGEQGAQE